MPQITISADRYEQLARRAAALNVTVEQLVSVALDRVVGAEVENGPPPLPAGNLPFDQWKARFEELLATAHTRADRYPPGFQADVSRESIYEGCGE
jgi:hypothetical protein